MKANCVGRRRNVHRRRDILARWTLRPINSALYIAVISHQINKETEIIDSGRENIPGLSVYSYCCEVRSEAFHRRSDVSSWYVSRQNLNENSHHLFDSFCPSNNLCGCEVVFCSGIWFLNIWIFEYLNIWIFKFLFQPPEAKFKNKTNSLWGNLFYDPDFQFSGHAAMYD